MRFCNLLSVTVINVISNTHQHSTLPVICRLDCHINIIFLSRRSHEPSTRMTDSKCMYIYLLPFYVTHHFLIDDFRGHEQRTHSQIFGNFLRSSHYIQDQGWICIVGEAANTTLDHQWKALTKLYQLAYNLADSTTFVVQLIRSKNRFGSHRQLANHAQKQCLFTHWTLLTK